MESFNLKVEEFNVTDTDMFLYFFSKTLRSLDCYSKEEKELNLKLKSKNRFLNRLNNGEIEVYIIKNANNEVVAFIEIEFKVSKLGNKYLYLNWIMSDYENYKGLGKKLINFIFDKFKNREYAGIFSKVKYKNSRSVLFHKRNGFKEILVKNGNLMFKKTL